MKKKTDANIKDRDQHVNFLYFLVDFRGRNSNRVEKYERN